jgi:ATP-binding cassette subfamily B protein
MTAPASIHDEDVLGKAYDGRLMRRLLAYARPYRNIVLGAVALLLADAALQLVGPLLTRRVIDVALPARDMGMVRIATVVFVAALAAEFACSLGNTMLTNLLGQRVMRDLRVQLFAHLQRLPVAYFDRNPAGRLITRVTSDVEALNEMFTAGVVAGLGDLFTLIAITVMMLIVDWRLALAAMLVIPFVVLTSTLFRAGVRDSYRVIRVRLAKINAFLQERLAGMRIVQLFGRERAEAERFDDLNRSHLDAHLRSIRVYALYFPAIELLTTVALASLLVTGARRMGVTALTIGTLAAFLQLVRRFFQPLQDLSEKYNILQGAMAASERIFALLDTPASPAAARADDLVRPRGGVTRMKAVSIEFDDVWFAYESGASAEAAAESAAEAAWVLRGVSFAVHPGRTLAVVGQTGAGKTTIISLLMRFYEPTRGRILLNGADIRDMPVDVLRAAIGYVQQDIFLFAGDVASNIRLGHALSDEAVARASARVGADRVIARLPGGLQYQLGERGASVSVGERQLLSFARAIAADPALFLLDEATSAVDSEIEAAIQRALRELMRGRTSIAVAHRLSTIRAADEILVLHHGRIVERGSHPDLLARHGVYERLYLLQAGVSAPGYLPQAQLASLPGGG